jgi:transmembrane sensor
MNRDQLTYLLAKYRANDITAAEVEELSAWLQSPGSQELFSEVVADEMGMYEGPGEDARFANMAQKVVGIDKGIVWEPVRQKGRVVRVWVWAAASVLIILLGGIYWWNSNQRMGTSQASKQPASNIIAPGKTGAILTLADGRQIVLDSVRNGLIASQPGANVQLKNGAITYEMQNEPADAMVYNTMSTPKGRQFQVTLPDGTKAWLNAGSTLRYPTRFSGSARQVEVHGEVYFEVKPLVRPAGGGQEKIPFVVKIVTSKGNVAEVMVLGTHFNINAYDNEPLINTTLLEGSVKVKAGASELLLRPGQQAQLGKKQDAHLKVSKDVNIDKVMAWKNGLFNFEGATLEEVMKQLERWYDIEVVYEGQPPVTRFVGEMEMNMPLNDLLGMLSEMKVHFRIEAGRKLVVTP